MQYEAVIGLEVHAQLSTNTKIFCRCSTNFGSEPNSQTCPVCLGLPGSLPVLNKKAVEFAIKTGLALNSRIASYTRFARKNYFYPDLPKNYQISQYELPICEGGYIEISVDEKPKRINLTRIHLEEDAGKNIHDAKNPFSLVDLNRTGVPLMEIVSEPDIRTPQEASEYMKKLRTILRYIEVCDGNMEQGSLRCDANVSVRPVGQKEFGVKVELKNMNSFKYVEKALEYEIKRQIEILQDGGKIIQETRLFDANSSRTYSMRSKEEAHDYRYFPDPDLVPVIINDEMIQEIMSGLPELPDKKISRFITDYNLTNYDAEILASDKYLAGWFEEVVRCGVNPKTAANWIINELLKFLNEDDKTISDTPIKPQQLANLIRMIEKGVISGKIAKTVFHEMYQTGNEPDAIVTQKGLVQISDTETIQKTIDEILAANPKEVERYKNGETKLLGFFAGQVMKVTKGKANPQMVNEILKKRLS
ncbi:MAG: Asp-tRNA(Asn)/Glu-tRNA(Gln) amidotransferase subunit GatB [Thermodesulfovibrionales bacterium]|nr:Asp-tRNA(Asn)/Glu-tRNA(Gln) amidotransferase subunit GatB [Thermodesulfovibrionales bacterium]